MATLRDDVLVRVCVCVCVTAILFARDHLQTCVCAPAADGTAKITEKATVNDEELAGAAAAKQQDEEFAAAKAKALGI